MPRRAKVRPDEPGREKILDAAREAFGERGFDGTSIAEIGRRAEISKSVLYHYFGSKAGLYRALLEHDAQALIAAVAAVVPASAESDAPRLRPGIDAFLEFLAEHPGSWKLMTRDAPADLELSKLHQGISDSLAEALRPLLAAPQKRTSRPELIELVALAVRTYAAWWEQHQEVPREQVVEAIGDVAAAGARRIKGV